MFGSLTKTSNPYYPLPNFKGISPDQLNMDKVESEQSHYQKSMEQTSPGCMFLQSLYQDEVICLWWKNKSMAEQNRTGVTWFVVVYSKKLIPPNKHLKDFLWGTPKFITCHLPLLYLWRLVVQQAMCSMLKVSEEEQVSLLERVKCCQVILACPAPR